MIIKNKRYLKSKLNEVICSYNIQGKTYTTKFLKTQRGWTVNSLRELTEEQLKYCLRIIKKLNNKEIK